MRATVIICAALALVATAVGATAATAATASVVWAVEFPRMREFGVPVVALDTVYQAAVLAGGNGTGILFALDKHTGVRKFSINTVDNALYVTVGDGLLWVADDANLKAYSAAHGGAALLTTPATIGPNGTKPGSGHPAYVDPTTYMNGRCLVAWPGTPMIAWQRQSVSEGFVSQFSTPYVVTSNIRTAVVGEFAMHAAFFTSTINGVLCSVSAQAQDGTINWITRFPNATGAAFAQAAGAGAIAVQHIDAAGRAVITSLDPVTGKVRWSFAFPVVQDFNVAGPTVVLRWAHELTAFDAVTGVPRWTAPAPKSNDYTVFSSSSIAVANADAETNYLMAYNMSNGAELWRYAAQRARYGAVSDDVYYVTVNATHFVALTA
jgi:outer membrane protein assembly factor BamB